MKTTEKHYVTFASPGTLFPEKTTKPIAAWDTKIAVELAETVTERYGATPYGFMFETRLEASDVPDGRGGTMRVEPKTIAESDFHYLGGRIETLDDVEARNDPKESTLRFNMQHGHSLVVVIEKRFRSVMPFEEKHVVVGPGGEIAERGDDPKWVAYRKEVRDRSAKATGQ